MAATLPYTQMAASNVGDLLRRRNINLNPEDVVTPSITSPVKAGMDVRIDRVRTDQVRETVPFEAPANYKDDATAFEGDEVVEEAGTPGSKEVKRYHPYCQRQRGKQHRHLREGSHSGQARHYQAWY